MKAMFFAVALACTAAAQQFPNVPQGAGIDNTNWFSMSNLVDAQAGLASSPRWTNAYSETTPTGWPTCAVDLNDGWPNLNTFGTWHWPSGNGWQVGTGYVSTYTAVVTADIMIQMGKSIRLGQGNVALYVSAMRYWWAQARGLPVQIPSIEQNIINNSRRTVDGLGGLYTEHPLHVAFFAPSPIYSTLIHLSMCSDQ